MKKLLNLQQRLTPKQLARFKIALAVTIFVVLPTAIFMAQRVGAAIVFNDTFTEGGFNEISLSAHTPDTGSGWTEIWEVGSFGPDICVRPDVDQIWGGQSFTPSEVCRNGNSKGSLYRINSTVSSADYEVSVTQVTGKSGDDSSILACRIQDLDNMYAVEFNTSATKLVEKVSGTWSTLDTGSGTADGSIITLICNGSTISVEDDGVEILSVTDSTHTSAGYAGIGLGAVIDSDDDVDGQILDNFEVNTLIAPDTTPPTPDPMTFSSAPASASTSSISMTASTATDAEGSTPVEYYFTYTACASNGGTGGTDSSWQSSTSYTDTGLEAGKCYGYTVKARDAEENETDPSSAGEATVESEGGGGSGGDTVQCHATLTDDLLSFWDFEDLTDSHGSNDLSSENGVPSSETGLLGSAIGLSGGLVALNSSSFDYNSDFTVAMWVYADNWDPAGMQFSLFFSDYTTGEAFIMGDSLDGMSASAIRAGNDVSEQAIKNSLSLATDSWHFLTLRWDESAGVATLNVNSLSAVQSSPGESTSGQGISFGGFPGAGGIFSGRIDSAGFWNRRLTDGEISDLYNGSAGMEYSDGGSCGGGGGDGAAAEVQRIIPGARLIPGVRFKGGRTIE